MGSCMVSTSLSIYYSSRGHASPIWKALIVQDQEIVSSRSASIKPSSVDQHICRHSISSKSFGEYHHSDDEE